MSKEYKELFLGKIEKILIEEEITIEGNIYQVGHNERYLKLAVHSEQDLTNQLVQAKIINKLTEEIMLCEITH